MKATKKPAKKAAARRNASKDLQPKNAGAVKAGMRKAGGDPG